jgi:hypothetical protein
VFLHRDGSTSDCHGGVENIILVDVGSEVVVGLGVVFLVVGEDLGRVHRTSPEVESC